MSAETQAFSRAPTVQGANRNHVNQTALFPGIPRNDGMTVSHPGSGSSSSDFGKPHYEFHRTLELWQDQFRRGGPRAQEGATVAEYNEALRRAFFDAGHSRVQVDTLMSVAVREQLSHGYVAGSKLAIPPRGVFNGLGDLL